MNDLIRIDLLYNIISYIYGGLLCCTVSQRVLLHCILLSCTAMQILYFRAFLCHNAMCKAVMHCNLFYFILPDFTSLYLIVLHCTALYCIVLRFTVLYCIVMHCTALYCVLLCCTAL